MKVTFKEILPDIISSRNATQKCLDDKDWSSKDHQYHKECRERAKNYVTAYNMLIEFIQLNEGKGKKCDCPNIYTGIFPM